MLKARLILSVILTLGVLFSPLAVEAQQAEKVHRIGFLSAPTPSQAMVDAFRQGLRENAYVEGRNLLIEWRSAEGKDERLPGLAAELVSLKAEVIVTVATSSTLAARKATATTPIVFTLVSDPVESGIVASLRQPSGNTTGITNVAVDLTGKGLELLKETIPSLKSVVILTNPANPVSDSILKEAQSAARRMGLEVRLVETSHSSELEPALTKIAHERASAVVLVAGPFLFTHRMHIAKLATKNRLPVLGWDQELAESGVLMSYGPNRLDMLRRAATYVSKILKGAKPADLPVEQPTKFELVINMKTAKALGLPLPPALLLRVDRVIE